MKDKVTLIRRLREGGNVLRCHALPHHGEYTDGKHSYDAVSMLLVLHPDPSLNLVKALLWHDTGERYVGDLPASAKWASPELRASYEKLEEQVLRSHFNFGPVLDALTAEDRMWIVSLDCIEFYLWVQDQLAFGNRHVEAAKNNILEAISKLIAEKKMPQPCVDFFMEGGQDWSRLPERFDR